MAWRSTFEWQQVWTCSRFFHTHLLSKEATLPSAAAEPKLRRCLCCSFSCESQMANQANYCCFCHEHLSWSPMNGTGSQSVVAFKKHKGNLVSGAAWQRSAAIASDSPQRKWATKMVEKMMVCLFVTGVVSLGSASKLGQYPITRSVIHPWWLHDINYHWPVLEVSYKGHPITMWTSFCFFLPPTISVDMR